jgi:hypothetical protein
VCGARSSPERTGPHARPLRPAVRARQVPAGRAGPRCRYRCRRSGPSARHRYDRTGHRHDALVRRENGAAGLSLAQPARRTPYGCRRCGSRPTPAAAASRAPETAGGLRTRKVRRPGRPGRRPPPPDPPGDLHARSRLLCHAIWTRAARLHLGDLVELTLPGVSPKEIHVDNEHDRNPSPWPAADACGSPADQDLAAVRRRRRTT